MTEEPDATADPATLRKRRLGIFALTAVCILAVTGIGMAGRFDFSIGLDNTWAGPMRLAVNGAVGDEAVAAHGAGTNASPASQAVMPSRGPTPAELEAYDAAQRELAAALQDRYRRTAAAINATSDDEDNVETADGQGQPFQDATAAMNETAAKLRQ